MVAVPGSPERIHLRPYQRLARSAAEAPGVLSVADGTLAVEYCSSDGQRAVLAFLHRGDALPAAALASHPAPATLRAITESVIELSSGGAHAEVRALETAMRKQLDRSAVHAMIVGCLDADARIASFLVEQTLRQKGDIRSAARLSLPMSRDDIADFLAIGRYTVGRAIMRLEALGYIERTSRHEVEIIDFDAIKSRTPLSSLLSSMHAGDQQQVCPA